MLDKVGLVGPTAEGPRPALVPDVSPLLASEPRFLRSLWQMCAEEPCGGTIRWGKARTHIRKAKAVS